MSSDVPSVTELDAEPETGDASPKLPGGWAWASLGEILPLQYGKALPERRKILLERWPSMAQADG